MNTIKHVYNNQIITEYAIISYIGCGGYSKCYMVKDIHSDEYFACKKIDKKILQSKYQQNELSKEIGNHRFLNHKYIVKFRESFQDQDFVYIITEFCNEGDLFDKLDKTNKKTIKKYIKQILEALDYMHTCAYDIKDHCGMIHHDIKLENIFVHNDGNIRIGDFGFSEIGPKSNCVKGTPEYMSPECANRQVHSFKIDIWSVGILYYIMLYGDFPFTRVEDNDDKEYVSIMAVNKQDYEDILKEHNSILKTLKTNIENDIDVDVSKVTIKYIEKEIKKENDLYNNMLKKEKKNRTCNIMLQLLGTIATKEVKYPHSKRVDVNDIVFLKKLLHKNPDKRLSARECLDDEFWN